MRTTSQMTLSGNRVASAARVAVLVTGVVCTTSLLLACSRSDQNASVGDTATQSASAPSPANASGDSAARAGRTTVRGRVTAASDTALTVTTRNGDVSVVLTPPVTVYTRVPGTLADVQSNTFVGVTSVPDPDGSQHATEIHIFPEALRGTGEGSYPMQETGSNATSRSTMTNGSVTAAGSGSSSRMTNGAAQVQPGGTITVQYKGGEQTIKVPTGVSITRIAPVSEKLARGANVIVMAMKQPSGALQSSAIFLSHDSTAHH